MWRLIEEDAYTGKLGWKRLYHIPHMKSKGRWQILKWVSGSKYIVFRDNLTVKQAQALIILMEE